LIDKHDNATEGIVHILVRCAAMVACLGACGVAQAQPDFPSRPIRLVIGFAPGGPSDIIGRAIALKMPQVIGQPMIVDNRAGANGIVGAELVAKAPPDGYTVYFATTGVLLSPIIVPGMSFNLFRDFEPVTFAATVPMLLAVHPSLPVKNVKELVAFAKARPGQLAYSSSGNASMGNLSMESFKLAAGINILHVPYKGAAQSVTDLVGGHVQTAILAVPPLLPQVKAGRVRALAVTTVKRSPALPDVPTMAEVGFPNAGSDNWLGALVPARTPKDVIGKLHAAFVKALNAPETREYLAAQGADVVAVPPEQFAAFLQQEFAKWEKVIRATKIRAD
jgi:tripartite-type tricarboxylate transporter receptor subunit TctC